MPTKAELLKKLPEQLKHDLVNFKAITFLGVAAAGPCTVTGLRVGDVVLAVPCITAGQLGDASASFEAKVTVADQLQQTSASNLSTRTYIVYVI